MKLNKNIYLDALAIIVLLIFVLLHIPAYSIAYFWDEAWVYGPSIIEMAENGPSLHPGAISVEYSRGHPLFFHFIFGIAVWIFGESTYVGHGFAMLISCIFGFVFYRVCSVLTNQWIAIFALILFLTQAVFFAQATLVLPEVLLGLICFLSLWFYYNNRFKLCMVLAGLGLLTKESFLVIIASFFLFEVGVQFSKYKLLLRKWEWKNLIYISASVIPFCIFLILQYFERGWFLYPKHVGLLFSNFENYFYEILDWLFLKQARNIILIFLMISLAMRLILRSRIEHIKLILLIIFIHVNFILFTASNFLTYRYLVLLVPLYLLVFIMVLPVQKFKFLAYVFCVASILGCAKFTLDSRQLGARDTNLSFWEYTRLNTEAVAYLEELNIYDEAIRPPFLIFYSMMHPKAGYRNNNKEFTNCSNEADFSDLKESYYIFSNLGSVYERPKIQEMEGSKLIKRFESEADWIEVYHINKNSE